MDNAISRIFEGVTGHLDGLPGIQIKSVNRHGDVLYEAAKGARFLGSSDSEVTSETVFWVASCTKIVVTIALLQCVERGQVTLETIPTDILPELKNIKLLRGWSDDGTPIVADPKRYPTIKEILSHQSGICVDIAELDLLKWTKYQGRKATSQTGNIDDLQYPMIFNPTEGWAYSVGMDWIGHLISRLNNNISLGEYFQQYVFTPLGLKNTTFEPLGDPRYRDRLTATHWRQPDGTLKQAEENAGCQYARSGTHNGGGGLWSTAEDFCNLLYGIFFPKNGHPTILRPESIEEMFKPCLATTKHFEATLARMRKETHYTPGGLDLLPQIPPDAPKSFGLGVAINLEDLETGVGAGSIQWSGFTNSFWWVDKKKGVVGVLVTSVLMFADPLAMKALKNFQTESYKKLKP